MRKKICVDIKEKKSFMLKRGSILYVYLWDAGECMMKIEKQIISLLENSESECTLSEIALAIEKPQKAVFKALRKLFEKGEIDCKDRKYKLSKRDAAN